MPPVFQPPPQPRRAGRRRDRHGRGPRGPAALPGPLSPHGLQYPGTAAERFDALVLDVVEELAKRWGDRWGALEFGVEETPLIPTGWAPDEVPLATSVPAAPGRPPRIVLFRRPIELRAPTRPELTAMVLAVLVEQLADLLGVPPQEVDPRYEG